MEKIEKLELRNCVRTEDNIREKINELVGAVNSLTESKKHPFIEKLHDKLMGISNEWRKYDK